MGTVFRWSTNNTFAVSSSFTGGNDGANPYGEVTPRVEGFDNTLPQVADAYRVTKTWCYGTTTRGGGDSDYGTVYKFDPATGVRSNIYSFTAIGADGAVPYGALVAGSNYYFQTTRTANQTTYDIVAVTNTMFGTTWQGGANNNGTIFKITTTYYYYETAGAPTLLTNTAFTTLYSFTGGTDGANPFAGLVQGSDGNFYGTTVNGGAYGCGTVFRVTPAGAFTSLYSFSGGNDGAHPFSVLALGPGAGVFYGTTAFGGASDVGAIFKITSTGQFTLQYSFTGVQDGAHPYAGLTSGGPETYYGTTGSAGQGGLGTVFKFMPNAATVTVTADPSTGGIVSGGGTYTAGQLVWVTAAATNTGYVFVGWNDGNGDNPRALTVPTTNVVLTAIFRPTHQVTVVASPVAGGTTTGTGTYPTGTVQQISATANSGWAFIGWNDGSTTNPYAILVPAADVTYTALFSQAQVQISVISEPVGSSTTSGSGWYNIGSTQTISATGNAGWSLGSWDDGDTNATRSIVIPAYNKTYTATFVQRTAAIVVQANPASGGTASGSGSYAVGTTQQISVAVNPGWSFNGWGDGDYPATRSVVIPDGGKTYTANLSQITAIQVQAAPVISSLYGFLGTDGAYPRAGLARGDDGLYYGTTYGRGLYGKGTLFRISSAGAITTLRHFGAAINDGANPRSTMLKLGGNFYGTTYTGGGASLNNGTLFRVNTAGGFQTIYSFNGGTADGANPVGSLVQDGRGNLIGTTQNGGANGNGTVFYLPSGGTEIPIHSFASSTDGSQPLGGLLVAADGNIYGTTSLGGSSGSGTAFRVSYVTDRYVLTSLQSFIGANGALPNAGLLQANGGNFYGTTANGGAANGNIFQMDQNGNVINLYAFGGTDGRIPRAKLMQAANGSFYGTTEGGGAHGYGCIFRLTTNGTFTTLYSFTGGTDGGNPQAELVQGPDGFFYGTAVSNGPSGYGTVFRISLPDPAVVTVQASPTNGGVASIAQSGGNVVLTATPNSGWIFSGWADGNTSNPRTVLTPPTNRTFTALFSTQAVVTVQANPLAGGTTGGGGTYWSGTNVSISATANSGWLFTGWDDGSTTTPRQVAVPIGGTNYTANFGAAATLTLQSSSNLYGTVSGSGTYLLGSVAQLSANPVLGGRFAGWSDGDTNVSRAYLVASNMTLTASFTNAPMYVLLQAGNGGMAGQWVLGTNYQPATWLSMTGPLGGGWVLRAINQHRVLLQAGNGGMIGLWDLNGSGTPTNWWTVSGALPGWIARDLDGNRVLLQSGDGGMVGIWTLNASNIPVAWKMVSASAPGLIARALADSRILLQSTAGTTIGYWTLDGAYNITAWVPISSVLPAGWVLRSMTPNYMLLQAGDGGMAGMWDLDASGQPAVWHTIVGPMPGWIMRGIDQP